MPKNGRNSKNFRDRNSVDESPKGWVMRLKSGLKLLTHLHSRTWSG